jgi:hypothetical protein
VSFPRALVACVVLVGHALRASVARADAPEPVAEPATAPAPEPLEPTPVTKPVTADGPDEGAPEGRAAPSTESARRGIAAGPIRAGLEIFAQYTYRQTAGAPWYHVFDAPRVHGAIEGERGDVRGRLVLEGVRSAAEGSLVGVAGDSLVIRVREAYAAYRAWGVIEASAGVIPTLTVPELDGTWMMRAIAPSALEASALLAPADLGVKIRSELPRGYGWVGASASNGEGYTSRELNRGKNMEGALEVHPLASMPALLPLAIFASYSAGSSGTALARANRVTAGLLWQGRRVRAGAYGTWARGVAELGTQEAQVSSVFVRAEPLDRVLLGARVDHVVRNAGATPADAITTVFLAAGYRIAAPLEAFLALTRSIPTTRADGEQPGSDLWDLRVIGRVLF